MIRPSHQRLLACLLLSFAGGGAAAQSDEPLYRQQPNDLVVLNKANGATKLETFPLDFPNRTLPRTLPRGGSLKARLLEGTAGEVEIPYANIDRIELFEQRLLTAALGHAEKNEFGPAFDYFARIDRDYPELEGYADEFANMLRAEALQRFRDGDEDHALALMQTLYDREPNMRGLDRAVDTIGESIISSRWKSKDYAGVRRAINTLGSQFAGLELSVNDRWLGRMSDGAEQLRDRAKSLAEKGRTREALSLLSDAQALDPSSIETKQLIEKLSDDDQTLWVGVWEAAGERTTPRLDRPAATRQSRLTGGRFATLEAYPPEGSEYASSLGKIESDAARRQLRVGGRKNSEASFEIARALLEPSEESDPLALLRLHTEAVSVDTDGSLVIDLKAPHPRPEALAKAALPARVADTARGDWRRVPIPPGSTAVARYERLAQGASFTAIEEYAYPTADAAIDALRAGKLHVLADVPPWKRTAVEATPDVEIASYRLPTLHCLLLSPDTPLRERRELRRAVCYALARKETLDELVLGGRPLSGCAALSAPFPRGISLSDPLRYAYNVSVEPRPYEPRLAALLIAAARATDRTADEEAKKAIEEGGAPPAAPKARVPNVLTIAYPPTPIARLSVESFAQLLSTIKVETRLIEASEADLAGDGIAYDLRYAEVTMAEPLVDSWRLLGPGGIAGGCSPPMLAGLERVQAAKTFGEATDALSDLHRIAFADLPLIPLWQTANQFAYSKSLRGVPRKTVDLYQTIDSWRVDAGGRR